MNTSEVKKNKLQIQDLFERLRKKLNSFKVISLSGQTIGRLKDFTLDKNRRLYMVIPQSSSQADSSVILLSSKYIEHVDPANRAVFVDISQDELNSLPLYRYSNKTELSSQSSGLPQQESLTGIVDIEQSQAVKTQYDANHLQETGNYFTRDESSAHEGETIRLLEERLIVNRSQRKLGEIVVRKEIETRIVEVPLKSEKLIVEKIDSETQQPVEVEQLPTRNFSTLEDSSIPLYEHQSFTTPTHENTDSADAQVVEEEIVRLLEERLVVNRRKWKVGEVIVRKEIETETVRVPIRREKLIVEQVGTETTETKILAEIDLAAGEVTGVELQNIAPSTPQPVANYNNPNTVVGEFLSPRAASNLLEAIALQKPHGCTKVRIELVVENAEFQETYQKMFDRCSTR